MVFIPLVYNSGDQNVLINDWYACLQVPSKQLTVCECILKSTGNNLVITPVFSFELPTHWDRKKLYDGQYQCYDVFKIIYVPLWLLAR